MLTLFSRRRRAFAPRPGHADDRLSPNRDVFTAVQEGITVLLDLRRQVYLGIDEVGSFIWQCIERGATLREIEQSLASEYDAPIETIRADAQQFLDDLVRRDLVVRA